MTADAIFSFVNTLVLPGWALLIFLPGWKWSARVVSGVVIPVVIGVVYAYVFLGNWGSGGGFGSIEDVRTLFENDFLLTAGWAHYLAFDLFIGAWEVRDARTHGIHHLVVIPCLLLTFMMGPVGLTLYFLIRWVWKREFWVGTEAAA